MSVAHVVRGSTAGFLETLSDTLLALSVRVDPGMADSAWPEPVFQKAQPRVPRVLGPTGQATSDSAYLVLEAIYVVQGAPAAADIAAGYADAFARFALRHPDAFDFTPTQEA